MEMERGIDCSIIIVNFNGKHFLKPCLDSIKAESAQFVVEVYVVDNNSTDGSCEFVKEKFPWVRLICNEENVGFAYANNQAIDLSSGRYIFLLNPDTILTPGSLKTIIEEMNKHADTGGASCKLLNSDGSLQFSIGTFPDLLSHIMQCLFLHRLFRRSKRAGHLILDKNYYRKLQEIDWAFGAALMVRRWVIEKIGKLDDRYFFGSEEQDLCYRIKQAGWKILYIPSAEIVHHGRGWREDPNIDEALIRGRLRFARKHYGTFQSLLFKVIMALNSSVRLVISIVSTVIFHKNHSLDWRGCRKYWIALRYCLSNGSTKKIH